MANVVVRPGLALSPAEGEEAVSNLKKLVQIPSVSYDGPSNGSYSQAVVLLRSIAESKGLQLQCSVTEPVKGKPALVCTWKGRDPKLQSLMLNSHYDVVPVDASKWTLAAPFSAKELASGDIVGRGTQDMKCVCIQYLEAIRALKKTGYQPLRSVHLTFVPDEEIGGTEGMQAMLGTRAFTDLNVGLALDEGLASPSKAFSVYYGQRSIWWIKIKATGAVGHGSRFVEDTAMPKLVRAIDRFLAFREQQRQRLLNDPNLKLGDVTTVNLTLLKGGHIAHDSSGKEKYSLNVIPNTAEAGFDIRIAPSVPLHEVASMVKDFISKDSKGEEIPGISIEYIFKQEKHSVTPVDDQQRNPWWKVFTGACKDLKMDISPEIFPAGTDSAFIRHLGIPAFGFSPMNETPILLHDNDERLNRAVFLRGISIYTHLIAKLADAAGDIKASL